MPAISKKQQQFMGIVHAIQKGEMKPSEATPEARAAAKSMKKKDVEDFAKTKHKGLPEKVPENIEESWINYGKKYPGDNISVGTKVKIDYGTHKGKMGKVSADAATDGYSIVKVAGKTVTYDNDNLLIQESLNEIKNDKDMVKDGLRYAKKKYKYDAKDLKDLAKDTLTYIKSGEIDDQPSMEAYIDFRHDEMKIGEIKEIIRGVVKEILNEASLPYNRNDIPKVSGWDVKPYQYDVRYIHKKTGLDVEFDFRYPEFIKYTMKYNGGLKTNFIKKDDKIKDNIKKALNSIPFNKINFVNENK